MKVEIAGIVPQADGAWMKQMAKNLTDPFDGFLKDTKFVVIEQDPVAHQKSSQRKSLFF